MSVPTERRRGAAAVVAVLTVLPLLPTLRAPFMYDDTALIRDNAWMGGWRELAQPRTRRDASSGPGP